MGNALTKYKARLAEAAHGYASEETEGGSFISTRGGILKLGEEEMPGNQMLVVILDAIHENTYYTDAFDPDNVLPPKCFAFGRSEREMEAHEDVPDVASDESYFELQSETGMCKDCEWSKFGSAERGRGKACTNRRRLAVIPAGRFEKAGKRDYSMEVYDDIDHFKNADLAFLKIPPTSIKEWSRYVKFLNREHNVPPFAVLTHIYIEPDPKTQFKVMFDFVEVLEGEDLLDTLFDRHEEAKEVIEQPYEEPSEEDLEGSVNPTRNGLKGLKKRKSHREVEDKPHGNTDE